MGKARQICSFLVTLLFSVAWLILFLPPSSGPPPSLPAFLSQPPLAVELLPFPADGVESNRTCLLQVCFDDMASEGCGSCRQERPGADEVPAVPEGWVPDVWKLRRFAAAGVDAQGRRFPPELPKEMCEPIGPEGAEEDFDLELFREAKIVAQPLRGGGPSLMCVIYTTEANHYARVRAVRETWAGGCDGWLAFSTRSDPRIPAISVPHAGKEEYDNIWQKVRSIWRFVAEHYLEEFGFFVIGGDDIFVLPQNLRNYLAAVRADPGEQHFLGRRLRSRLLYNSGGAGYVLSRRTLASLYGLLEDRRCSPRRRTFAEDVMVADCLGRAAGVQPSDTRDAFLRERFHPLSPSQHLLWRPPKDGGRDWYEDYNRDWGLGIGKNCCSSDSVTFHYITNPARARHLYALLYTCGMFSPAADPNSSGV